MMWVFRGWGKKRSFICLLPCPPGEAPRTVRSLTRAASETCYVRLICGSTCGGSKKEPEARNDKMGVEPDRYGKIPSESRRKRAYVLLCRWEMILRKSAVLRVLLQNVRTSYCM